PHAHKVAYTEDFGQVAFTIDARPGCPIDLTKYMVYHTSQTASAEELCGRAEWTMDRVMTQGFEQLLASQEQYMDDFWRRSDVRVNIRSGGCTLQRLARPDWATGRQRRASSAWSKRSTRCPTERIPGERPQSSSTC